MGDSVPAQSHNFVRAEPRTFVRLRDNFDHDFPSLCFVVWTNMKENKYEVRSDPQHSPTTLCALSLAHLSGWIMSGGEITLIMISIFCAFIIKQLSRCGEVGFGTLLKHLANIF